MVDLIERLEKATGPDRELDAHIVAELHNAIVKPYPPTDDFGPRDKWQFWSRDGQHFLASDGKWKIPKYTASIDAALTLVPARAQWTLEQGLARVRLVDISDPTGVATYQGHTIDRNNPAIALCIAALRAQEPSDGT